MPAVVGRKTFLFELLQSIVMQVMQPGLHNHVDIITHVDIIAQQESFAAYKRLTGITKLCNKTSKAALASLVSTLRGLCMTLGTQGNK